MGQKGRPSPKETRGAAASAAASEKAETTGSGSTAKSNAVSGNKKGAGGRGADAKGLQKLAPGATKAGGGKKGEQLKKAGGQQRGAAVPRPTLSALQPVKQMTHWDYVLTEMKWMATDFMQERRWKMAAGAHLSRAVLESGKVKVEEAESKANGEASENGGEATGSGKDAGNGADDPAGSNKGDNASQDGGPTEPSTPPKASEAASWCLHYELTQELKKAFMAHISEMDDQRALAQDLRYQEYMLDYDAACAGVALGHQVAKAEAARLAAEQLRQAERARLEAEEQIRKNKRLKKKSSKALENMETADEDSPLLTGMPGMPRSDSMDLDTPQQRKKDKKRKKKGEEDLDMDSADKGLKRTSSAMDAAGVKGMEQKKSKKAKGSKAGAAEAAAADGIKGRMKKGVTMPGDLIAWTPQEDQLLFAIVHEFGANWVLVADVLSSGSALQGVFRRPDQCKSRYKALTQQSQDGNSTEPAFASLKLTKGAAREVLTSAMPVPELVLNRQISTLARVSLRLVTSLEDERKRKIEANGQRHMIHASHGNIEMTCLQKNGQKLMTPLELAAHANRVIPPNSNNLVPPSTSMQQAASLSAPAAQQPQQQQLGTDATQGGMAAGVQPVQQRAVQPGAMGAPAPAPGALPAGQQQAVQGIGVSGAMATASGQLLPQAGAAQQQVMQPAANQQMLAGSGPNAAAVQAAIQARQQQLQAHVAQIAQQRGLTPAQQQALLAKVTQQQAQQLAQQQAQRMAQQQQASQGMAAGVASQPMQMQPQQPGAVQAGMTPQALQAAQQQQQLMQRVSSAQHMTALPVQQQLAGQPVVSGVGVQQQQMAGMAMQPGMVQQPQMMQGGQMQQQPQMAMGGVAPQGQPGAAQVQGMQQQPGMVAGVMQPAVSAPVMQQQQQPGAGQPQQQQ